VLLVLAMVFPLLMLLALVGMERVERPLYVDEIELQLEGFLDTASSEEVETFVALGFKPALDRYWRRRHHGLPARP
jgi:hypothetical protein